MNLRYLACAGVIIICNCAATAGASDAPSALPLPLPLPSAAPSSIATSVPVASSSPAAVVSPSPGPSVEPSLLPSPPSLPSPSPSPPPPPVRPRDARGISAITPPIEPQSPVPTPTIPDALWFAPSETSTIPIDIHDGVIFVPVVADGKRRTFLLDTRGNTAVDNSMSAVPMGPEVVLGTLQIGDVRLTNLLAAPERILPYSVTYLGAAADGVVGMDFLSRYPITIDYANRRLTLYHTSAAAEIAAQPAGTATLSLAQGRSMPATTALVAGKYDGEFAFDLLATTEVVVSDGFARAHRLATSNGWKDTAWLARPSGEIAGRMGRIASLSLGSLDFVRPITVAASPTEPNALPHGADGAVGAWLLRRFTVTLDVPGEKLVLAPGSSTSMATAPFDRSGAWLVQRAGFVEVRSVLPGSPADDARLRSGDQLLALNGRAVSALEDVRSAFEGALGTSIAVRFHRGIWTRTTKLTLHTVM